MTETSRRPVPPPEWTLRFESLGKSYGPQVLFEDLSFAVRPGQAVRVSGANGSGKTQLLLCLGGFVERDAGSVRLEAGSGRRVLTGSPWRLDPLLRYVPSLPGEVRALPVALATFALARALSPYSLGSVERAAARSFYVRWRGELEARVGEGMDPARPMATLSIGQQKRLLLASILLCSPRPHAFLVDEPLAGVDRAGMKVALDLLAEVRNAGAAVLVAEHRAEIDDLPFDLDIALPYSRRPLEASGPSQTPPLEASPATEPMTPEAPVLELRDACAGYPGAEVVCPALSLRAGEIALIEGANGAGKTGFLKGLLGVAPARFSGEVRIRGLAAPSLVDAMAGGQIRYLDQARRSFDHLHVADAVRVAAPGGTILPEEIREAMSRLGPGKRVATLSAGSRALLALCQTLAVRPVLGILDEPFANVDARNRVRMLALLEAARTTWRTAFLVVEHTGDELTQPKRYRIDRRPDGDAVLDEADDKSTTTKPPNRR